MLTAPNRQFRSTGEIRRVSLQCRLCNFSGSNAARFYWPATGAGAIASVGDAHRRKIDSPVPSDLVSYPLTREGTGTLLYKSGFAFGLRGHPLDIHLSVINGPSGPEILTSAFSLKAAFYLTATEYGYCAISQSWLAECPNSGRPPSFTRIRRCALAVARSAIALTAFGLEHGMLCTQHSNAERGGSEFYADACAFSISRCEPASAEGSVCNTGAIRLS